METPGFHNLTNPQPTDMAGNLFDIHSNEPGDFDDMNNEANDFNYYYPFNAPDYPNTQPKDFTDQTVNDISVLMNYLAAELTRYQNKVSCCL